MFFNKETILHIKK